MTRAMKDDTFQTDLKEFHDVLVQLSFMVTEIKNASDRNKEIFNELKELLNDNSSESRGKVETLQSYMTLQQSTIELHRKLLVLYVRVAVPELASIEETTSYDDLATELQKYRPDLIEIKNNGFSINLEQITNEVKQLSETQFSYINNALSKVLDRRHISIPSSLPYYGTIQAISNNTQFKRTDESPWPTARIQHGEAVSIIELKPDTPRHLLSAEVEQALTKHMWAQCESLSDDTADVLDAVMCMMLSSAKTPDDRVLIHVDHVLKLRGLTEKLSGSGRRGGFMPEQRTGVIDSLFAISNIWMTYEGPVYQSKSKKPIQDAISSRLLVVTDLKGQKRIDGQYDWQETVCQLGYAFGRYLWTDGRQTALLSAKALNYHPGNQIPEKRLTRYFAWQWKIRARQGNYQQPFKVRTLLEVTGIKIDRNKPLRTKERMEKALETLHADKVTNNFDYDKKTWDEETDGGRRSWFDKWLNSSIIIEPPDEITSHYFSHGLERTKNETKQLKPVSIPGTLGERLIQIRTDRGLSQAIVAETLCIDQGYLSKIERGQHKAKMSKSLIKKIEDWIHE